MTNTRQERAGPPGHADTMRDAIGLVTAVWHGNRTDVMALYQLHRDDPSGLVGAMGALASTLLEGWAATIGRDPTRMLQDVSLALCGADD